MYLSELITKHLGCNSAIVVKCKSICTVCGKDIQEGVRKKDIIKSSFTDYEYLKYKSDYLCKQCSALIGQITINGEKTWLRNFSFVASTSGFNMLKREQIQEALFDPPDPPFVFCVTYSHKKQIAIKASLQYNSGNYIVYTDKGNVEIIPHELAELNEIISQWYSVVPETVNMKQPHTFFTKQEILSGSDNFIKIEKYGVTKYFKEDNFISTYRGTGVLKLLVFALNILK